MNDQTREPSTPTEVTGRSPLFVGGQGKDDTQSRLASDDLLLTGQSTPATHWPHAGQQSLVGSHANCETQSSSASDDLLLTGHGQTETHMDPAGQQPLRPGHNDIEHQVKYAGPHQSAGGHSAAEPHYERATGNSSDQPPAIPTSNPTPEASDGWLELRIWAEMFHDAQQQRIASINRAERGGVDPALYISHIEAIERSENTARLGMVRCYRRVVPTELRNWQIASRGIGEHQMARLLGHLGDPYVATPHHWEGTGSDRTLIADEPYIRTISQLWSYCGHGDPARRRTKGMTVEEAFALGKPFAKSLLFQIAESCMKAGGEYRLVYDQRRLDTAERAHATPCVRCGPSGKPAPEGSPWSKAHQHADALRVLGKEILRDMWLTRRATELAVAA